MKKTKRIFYLKGDKPELVTRVIQEISGFKAVNSIPNPSPEDILYTFSKNKNLVCQSLPALLPALSSADCITVFVTSDTKRVFLGGEKIDANENFVGQFMTIADNYSVDLGDHISNCHQRDKNYNSECKMCKIVKGLSPEHPETILYETDKFIVFPGKGAFVSGYLMIVPKEHVMSCAELSSSAQEELWTVISDITEILNKIYSKKILVWENGSGNGGYGKPTSSIVHAHVHLCPSNLDVTSSTEHYGVPLNPIYKKDLSKYQNNPYLLIVDNNSAYIQDDEELYIPRQFVRQLIADEHGLTSDIWNWRENAFWNEVDRTAKKFLSYISENYIHISPRIRSSTKKSLQDFLLSFNNKR